MFSAQVGLWIDPTRALIVFAKSLTAHVVESRLLSSTRFYDNVIHALGAPGPLLVVGPGATKGELFERLAETAVRPGWVVLLEQSRCWRDRDILVELAERLRGE